MGVGKEEKGEELGEGQFTISLNYYMDNTMHMNFGDIKLLCFIHLKCEGLLVY